MSVPDYEDVSCNSAIHAEETIDCHSVEETVDQESDVEWDRQHASNSRPQNWTTHDSSDLGDRASNLLSSPQIAFPSDVSNSSSSGHYITVRPQLPRASFSKPVCEAIPSTFRRHASVSSWLADEASFVPPANRQLSGVAFVPLSDRIPSFIRQHHTSEFVLMATPKEIQQGRSCERSSRSSRSHSQELELPFFEGGRRNSLGGDNEEFEYCSATEPLQAPSRLPPSIYHRNIDAVIRKQARQLRKPRPKNHSTTSSGCNDCMSRVPYATLIATLMCCVGVGVFCGTMYRGTMLTMRLLEEVFRLQIQWVEPVQLTFLVVGAGMGGLGLMILFVGCLSTGATRARVYSTWRGRVGGRISCAVFMGLAYVLVVVWLAVFAGLVLVTLMYSVAWLQCQSVPENQCIDYNQFGFLFPWSTPEEDKRVCQGEKKLFCKDFVNNAEVMFILATCATFLVILSLIHYLMCLAANYAHIKDQEKFMDLQELQYIRESSEMSTLPKDRF